METLQFKTNIKCGGCIDTVTPYLNALPGVDQWEVETQTASKVLTVKGNTASSDVVDALKKAGYQAEPI